MNPRVLLFVAFLALSPAQGVDPSTVPLWPKDVPGEKEQLPPEKEMTKENEGKVAGKRVIRLGNVSTPTLSIFRPAAKKTDTAILICPGGGYNILAWDLEGTEVCDWLNSQGMTAFLLKYRVPKRAGLEKHAPALQDAQRAMALIRQNAKEWGVDPHKIGVLGFSAGGHLSAALSNAAEQHAYPAMDAADEQSTRPDFTVLIYPAYLSIKEQNDKIAPELQISSNTPPAFIAITMDDPVRVENVFAYAQALKNVKVPVELHIYPKGGHGYGLRRAENLVTTWPDRLADWLKSRALLP